MEFERLKNEFITPSLIEAGWDTKNIRIENNEKLILYFDESTKLAIIKMCSLREISERQLSCAKKIGAANKVRFVFVANKINYLFYDLKTGEKNLIKLSQFPSPLILKRISSGD